MRQHTNLVIKVIATATAVITVAACGSSGNGSGGGSANNNSGPVGGASTTITAVGTGATTGGGGGGGSPYSTGPVMQSAKVGARSAAEPFFFTPTPDTVSAGSTVTFAFQNVGHTVTFDTPGSPANISSLAAGGVTNADSTRVFSTPGTYMYHCSIHTYMMGTVVVQ